MASLSLQHMPLEVTAHILQYVGDAGDLLNCEKTCKMLHRILRDDEVWSSCPGGSHSNSRHGACQDRGFRLVKRYQKRTESILLEALGIKRWKFLVFAVLEVFFPDYLTCGQLYLLRGDTSAVLMELVEDFSIIQLKRAVVVMKASTQTCDVSSAYPTLTCRHWEAQNQLHSACPNGSSAPLVAGVLTHPIPRDVVLVRANTLLKHDVITTVIRRMAYRAGIIKMEDAVFNLAWGSLAYTIVALLRPACIELTHAAGSVRDRQNSNKKKVLYEEDGQTMHTVSPFSKRGPVCCCCGNPHFAVHTPVPGQIEAAARSLFIPCKVYGNVWHCMEDTTVEEERAAAEAEYAFEEYYDDDEDEAWFNDYDSDSLSEMDSDFNSGDGMDV